LTDQQVLLRQLLERMMGDTDISRLELFPTVRRVVYEYAETLTAHGRRHDILEGLYISAMLHSLGMRRYAMELADALALASSDEQKRSAQNWQGILATHDGHYAHAESAFLGSDGPRIGGGDVEGLPAVNLAVVYFAAGNLKKAQEQVDFARNEGLGTQDPRADILLAFLDVELAKLTNNRPVLEAATKRLRNLLQGALSDPELDSRTDELRLLMIASLATFDQARIQASAFAMREAADLGTLAAEHATSMLGLRDPRAVVFLTRTLLNEFEAACGSGATATAGGILARLDSAYRLTCAVFGDGDRRAAVLSANIASARLEHARMRRSVEDARAAVAALEIAARRVFEAYPSNHPTSVIVATNLASAAFDLARAESSMDQAYAAVGMLESAADRANSLFGPQHPATEVARREVAACRALLDQPDDDSGSGATLTRAPPETRRFAPPPGFDREYVSLDEAARLIAAAASVESSTRRATATGASSELGRRIVGAERATLAKDLVKRYTNGESIRSLASSTGRSYGFVHRVLTESGVQLRQRGGVRRRKKSL